MKKSSDVLQLSLIVLAVVIGFSSLQYFISTISSVIFIIIGQGVNAVSPYFFIAAIQALACWLLIMKSKVLAAYIYEKSQVGTNFKIISQPEDLLYVLLIIIGIYFLLDTAPLLIKGIVNEFKSKAVASRYDSADSFSKTDWTYIIICVLLPLLLLMFAKNIAGYFSQKVSEEPFTFEGGDEHYLSDKED